MKGNFKAFFSKGDRVRLGYAFAFFLLLFTLSYTTIELNVFVRQSQEIQNVNKVIYQLESVIGSMKDAETGVRGYLIMNDEKFLEPYNHTKLSKIEATYKNLLQLAADDAVLLRKLPAVKRVINARFDVLEKTLSLHKEAKNQVTDSVKTYLQLGKSTMDSVRNMISEMQAGERTFIEMSESKMQAIAKKIQVINVVSLIVSLLIGVYSVYSFTRENNARLLADSVAETYRQKLQSQVHELRQANEELVSLRRDERFASTGRIARTIAHEVRNPLTNINLAIEQVKEELSSQESDIHGLLDMVARNSTRINQLVTELLNSTRFSELNFGTKSINDLLDEALTMAADRIELHHVKLTRIYSPDICEVNVDADKIKIAFLNIIVNSIEAMEINKGELIIRTEGIDDTCYTYITDNGHGMNEDALQRLFEPYFTRKAKGNGLGMTNTQNIVLNHKGTINVESVVGKGTTFIIGLKFPE